MKKKITILGVIFLTLFSSILVIPATGIKEEVIQEQYWTLTRDLRVINMYRYTNTLGTKLVPIILIPGWSENHLIFDPSELIEDRSIAEYLAHDMRDVWVIDLRTHDTDGDPGTAADNEELMNKYWDFDKTYVKKDLVAAFNYIKWKTGKDSFVLGGHSMGGSLAIAYAEIIGQENLAGIMTIASPGKPTPIPPAFQLLRQLYCDENGHVKLFAPRNFDPNNANLIKLMFADMASYDEGGATEWWLNWDYMGTLNDEPAGVCADLWWGLDGDLHEHWLDPDGYDYTTHMSEITVPFLGVCGIQDEMVPLVSATAFFDDNLLGSTDTTSLVFDGYGHIDLLIGKNAPVEVYPEIRDWLNNRFS